MRLSGRHSGAISWPNAQALREELEKAARSPVPASRSALKKAGWKHTTISIWKPTRPLPRKGARSTRISAGIPRRVNVNGGAIAIGHPIGASGARVLVTLLHEMKRRNSKKGRATLCIGGGMGIAMCVERG
ncbi:MAG: hypothetical protein WA710_08830 [Pseudolabrys sp.]